VIKISTIVPNAHFLTYPSTNISRLSANMRHKRELNPFVMLTTQVGIINISLVLD